MTTSTYTLFPYTTLFRAIVNNNIQRSTWFMQDGDFLRLKQAEIGFTLPDATLRALHIANARFYLNGINLLTVSSFKLWDVEMGGNGLGYPVQRVINLGVHVTL